ncbi:efflux RND transporter permease subunit [Cocleimonas sp. KMM 6892]|uniref:efflux RND transporter permease subunit n=1 Tax=unclassified Cocleimonas TaxID=2639732 RepID=UPI002DB7865A|nr:MULTISPECIES: efflux RND transporter permease subunit [unclassified Cocleimonas]MEB8432992.1 efflux RND transporter permease subunit [Cocleimonas sp. KMM 6892]MEC4716027.1 efflux RND transporter permease subunit [Cocleimonas sp. KMM 6895]MEC4745488.1 efflux RND transporter permease subunit [Cocleimonas sp. KMM 6896]
MKHSAGIAGWAIFHPIGVIMLMLTIIILGLFSLSKLNIDLLPEIIYPEVRTRIIDAGVPATIMEDEITRQLEEQLAITEGAISVISTTQEGRSAVDLSFAYGTDIDVALRDASTRLDRAKRFLPDSIDPPVIYKRDPSQRPIAEYVLSSPTRTSVELDDWGNYTLSKWLLNLPGVASIEVGGGRQREIQVITDSNKLAAYKLDITDISEVIQENNQDTPAGRFYSESGEISGRTASRFNSVNDIENLPLPVTSDSADNILRIKDVAFVQDGMADEKVRIRLNGEPGLKVSLQKQPQANTVSVYDGVANELEKLAERGQIPEDITIKRVDDQAQYIRQSLKNASSSALTGAILAMLVVYIFLGNIRRTLIIGSAIPIAVLVTMIFMSMGGLTLNIMTLGGLALGIGMLVDNTIVMLENIYRHQKENEDSLDQAVVASSEVNSAIIASTTTNLAAVLPFLFIGGLIGLLFRELIFTISSAIVASLLVAITLVPALAARVPAKSKEGILRRAFDATIKLLQNVYGSFLSIALKMPILVIILFLAVFAFSIPVFQDSKFEFLPKMENGEVSIRLTADPGISLDEMDTLTKKIESLITELPDVDSLFTLVGGGVYGRSTYERSNRADIKVLLDKSEKAIAVDQWIKLANAAITKEELAGVKVRIRNQGIRGIRVSQGEDDLNLRIKGPNLLVLESLADQAVESLNGTAGIRNVQHSSEGSDQELTIKVDRERAAQLGLSTEEIGNVIRFAVGGRTVTDFIQNDKSIDVLMRLDRSQLRNPDDLGEIILFTNTEPRQPVRLSEVANLEWEKTPASIMRDRQQRVIEITASLTGDLTLEEAYANIEKSLENVDSPAGYSIYEAGELEAIKENQRTSQILLGLAMFLVFVVMAVHYESLRDPIIIMLSVPFAAIGVALGLLVTGIPLSMPVWLGTIMLAGIVVNNTIVLVETIELKKEHANSMVEAIIEAAKVRLRPILMTTLTTVVGMIPLAMALGKGSEMLQPLAISIVAGLSFSVLVTLFFVPSIYKLIYRA